jgi:hypothetical protein
MSSNEFQIRINEVLAKYGVKLAKAPSDALAMAIDRMVDNRLPKVDIFKDEKTYGDGYGAGYAQAIGDADAALRQRGDDRATRNCRKAILDLVNVSYDPAEVKPRPDWSKYRVPAVRDYPTPKAAMTSTKRGSE